VQVLRSFGSQVLRDSLRVGFGREILQDRIIQIGRYFACIPSGQIDSTDLTFPPSWGANERLPLNWQRLLWPQSLCNAVSGEPGREKGADMRVRSMVIAACALAAPVEAHAQDVIARVVDVGPGLCVVI